MAQVTEACPGEEIMVRPRLHPTSTCPGVSPSFLKGQRSSPKDLAGCRGRGEPTTVERIDDVAISAEGGLLRSGCLIHAISKTIDEVAWRAWPKSCPASPTDTVRKAFETPSGSPRQKHAASRAVNLAGTLKATNASASRTRRGSGTECDDAP